VEVSEYIRGVVSPPGFGQKSSRKEGVLQGKASEFVYQFEAKYEGADVTFVFRSRGGSPCCVAFPPPALGEVGIAAMQSFEIPAAPYQFVVAQIGRWSGFEAHEMVVEI
jgi:hypothetical protein